MENSEISQYTKKLTDSIFSQLYQSFGPKKPKRKVFKDPPKKAFKRLETDSSDEELKPIISSHSVQIQTEDFLSLQEELRKKDLEIQELKQILLETQQKLQKQNVSDTFLKDLKEETLENNLKENQEPPTKSEKKFVGKFEDLIFVSRKNKLLFEDDPNDIIDFTNSKDPSRTDPRPELPKDEQTQKIEKHIFEPSNSKAHLEKTSKKTPTPQPGPSTPSKPFSNTPSANSPTPESPLPESVPKSNPIPSTTPQLVSFTSNLSVTEDAQLTSEVKNPVLYKSLNSSLASIDSFRDFEAMLSNHSLSEESQSKFYFQETVPKVKEGQLSYLNQGTSTDWNDPDVKVRESFTFDPVFQILPESNQESTKPLIKRSRNSSLPWIDEPLPEGKPIKIKPFRPQKSRPKTQEKPQNFKQTHDRVRAQLPKKPQTHYKEHRLQIRPRANSHNKTKAKKPEKHSQRHLVKEDILDDIIFDEEQDMATWTKLMNKFRQNPVIISRLLKSRGRPSTQEDYQRMSNTRKFEKLQHVEYIGRGSSTGQKPETSSINSVIDFRPISAPEITPKPYSQNTRRVKDPDWSVSLLDGYVTQKKMKFNFIGDGALLGSQDIDEHVRGLQSGLLGAENQKKVFMKAVNTLNTLKKELILPEFWVSVPAFCAESLAQALSKCQKLLKARALTIKAIELIHYRENLLLEIMSYGKENKERFAELERINEELMQVLVFWKYMELPFTCFVYLGEDYYAKIHEDNTNLASIFPQFHVENIFKAQVTNDSFNFDI